jgi:hypothetical protein
VPLHLCNRVQRVVTWPTTAVALQQRLQTPTTTMALFQKFAVVKSPDFERIMALPRRTWHHDEALIDALSTALRKAPSERLRPVQAWALTEVLESGVVDGFISEGGGLLPIGCSGGKTLISLLLPTVIEEAKKVLIVQPAKLREKTLDEMSAYRRNWHIRDRLGDSVISYDKISADPAFLEEYDADLWFFDEGHKLKNPASALVRRIARIVHRRREEKRPTIVVVATGTLTTRSINEYAHICEWIFGAQRSPLPLARTIRREWAGATDAKVESFRRRNPGVLLQLATAEEKKTLDPVQAARRGIARRLKETAGVIWTDSTFNAVPLIISCVEPPYTPAKGTREILCLPCEGQGCRRCGNRGVHTIPNSVDGAFMQLRNLQQTPDGLPVPDASARWRHAREYASGFYYTLNPRPPRPWLKARTDWHQFVVKMLDKHMPGIDSMGDVARQWPQCQQLAAWHAVKHDYNPDKHREAVWLDASILTYAIDWLRKGPGLVWVEHVAFGERLAALTGLPYCSEQGCDARGVQAFKQRPDRGVICSVQSIGEGQNMQAWSRNLVISCTPHGRVWEQMLSRTHRDNQTRQVDVDVLVSCTELYDGFQQALEDADNAQESTGPQKLLIADVTLNTPGAGPRWAVNKRKR